MYGTIFQMKVKPGQHRKVVEFFESWDRERKPNVQGVKANFLMKPDGKARDLIGVAVFENKEFYEANAGDPEQDSWFRRLRELLEDDPQWEDVEYLVGTVG